MEREARSLKEKLTFLFSSDSSPISFIKEIRPYKWLIFSKCKSIHSKPKCIRLLGLLDKMLINKNG